MLTKLLILKNKFNLQIYLILSSLQIVIKMKYLRLSYIKWNATMFIEWGTIFKEKNVVK